MTIPGYTDLVVLENIVFFVGLNIKKKKLF